MVRYKNRYLLLEWKFSSAEVGHKTLEGVSAKSLLRFFKDRVKAYHGDYGVACIQHSLTVKYHNLSTLVTIVRCARAHHRAVWSALCGTVSYNKQPCTLSLLHLAGTIQSSQRTLVKHNLAAIKKCKWTIHSTL